MIARAYPTAHAGLTARTYGPPGLEEDIAFCARESVLDVVPRFAGLVSGAAEWSPTQVRLAPLARGGAAPSRAPRPAATVGA